MQANLFLQSLQDKMARSSDYNTNLTYRYELQKASSFKIEYDDFCDTSSYHHHTIRGKHNAC